MSYGGEVSVLEKINRLDSYLSEGLPRYQDILEKQNRAMPEAPEGLEYKNPRNNGKSNIHSFNKKI